MFSIIAETLSGYKYTVWYAMESEWTMDYAEIRGSYDTIL